MLCFLTARTLKPGAYDDFRRAWEPPGEWPAGFTKAYHVRDLEDPDEIVSFGFFDGGPEDLARLRTDERMSSMREAQMAAIEPHVLSVGTDGVFEVVEEVTPSS